MSNRYHHETIASIIRRQGAGNGGEADKQKGKEERMAASNRHQRNASGGAAMPQEFGALAKPSELKLEGARNSAVPKTEAKLDPKAAHLEISQRNSAAGGGHGRPAPRQETRLATARTYTGLYRARHRIGSLSSRGSVGSSSGGSRGSATTKDRLLQKVKTIYDQRLSQLSQSTTNLGTTSLASGAPQDSVRDRLTKKYGTRPSFDRDADPEHQAPVINVKISSQVVGPREADRIEFQPLRKNTSGVTIPPNQQKREAFSIRLEELEGEPTFSQRKSDP